MLSLFGNILVAQTKTPSKTEIAAIAKEANELMRAEKYENSLIKARLALKYANTINDDDLQANCYNTIAANFDDLGEYNRALFYYKKGIIHANKTNNNHLKNWLNNNLGNIYCFDKKDYTKGIHHYLQALEYSKKSADTSEILLTKLNITWAYFEIGNYKEGIPYLLYINKYQKRYGDPANIVAIYMLNAMHHANQHDYPRAASFFEKAIFIGKRDNLKSDLSFTYEEYSKFLFKDQQYKKAYENLGNYNKLVSELAYDEKLKKLEIAGINLEIDEYKRELEKIESNRQTLLAEQHKNKQAGIIVIALLMLTIVLLYFLFRNKQLLQKSKIHHLENQRKDELIAASMDGQETERKKIAHFLHDNISASLSAAGLHLTVFTSENNKSFDEIEKSKEILSTAHNQIRELSHNLLPSLLVHFGLYYALEDLCKKYSNSKISINFSSVEPPEKRYDPDFETRIYYIINELLNNAIKHSKAKNVTLTVIESKEKLLISIKDDGIGFSKKEESFTKGFGLNQIKSRVKQMKGDITILSNKNKGTFIQMIVPITNLKN